MLLHLSTNLWVACIIVVCGYLIIFTLIFPREYYFSAGKNSGEQMSHLIVYVRQYSIFKMQKASFLRSLLPFVALYSRQWLAKAQRGLLHLAVNRIDSY